MKTDNTALRVYHVALVALILLSLGASFWGISDKGLWWDESLSLHRAQHNLSYILSGHIDFGDTQTIDQHPPLYFILLSGVTRLFGESDTALRSLSAVFAALSVWLLALLGTEIANRRVGLLAALLGTLSPLYLWYAQEARMYTMLVFITLLATLALIRACKRRSLKWLVLYGLATVAGIFTQYMYVLIIPAQVLAGLLLMGDIKPLDLKSRRPRHFTFIMAITSALVVFGLVLVYLQVSSVVELAGTGRSYVLPHTILIDALHSSLYGLAIHPQIVMAITILAGAAIILGIYSLSRSNEVESPACRRGLQALFILWLITPALGFWIYSLLFGPVYMGSRYVITCSPAIYLTIALAVDYLNQKTRWTGWLVLGVIIAGMAYATYNYRCAPEYAAKEDHRSAALYVMAEERPGDCIILDAPENWDAFMHYYEGDLPVIPLPSEVMSGDPDAEHLALELQELVETAGYTRFWLVEGRTMYSDPDLLVQTWLDDNLLLLGEIFFPSSGSTITVQSYAPAPEVGTIEGNVEALVTWDSRLALLEQNIRYQVVYGSINVTETSLQGESSPAIESDESIVVSWQLAVLDSLDDYKVSLRLTDERGVLWTQSDRLPYLYLPTSQWIPGSIMQLEQDVRIPAGTPPGIYTLTAVIYDAASGRPLSAEDAATGITTFELDLGQIQIVANPTASSTLPDTITQPSKTWHFDALDLEGWQVAWLDGEAVDTIAVDLYWRAGEDTDGEQEVIFTLTNNRGMEIYSTSDTLTSQPAFALQEGQQVLGKLQFELPADTDPDGLSLSLALQDSQGNVIPATRGLFSSSQEAVELAIWP